MHSATKTSAAMISAVDSEVKAHPRFGFAGGPTMTELDPETAAERYLHQALASKSVRTFSVPRSVALETDFKTLGTETIPLTGTIAVKFRQTLNKIPIYGSLVTVELDNDNKLVSLSSAMGEPSGVSPIAKASPADALEAVKKYGDLKKNLENAVPRIYFYYDPKIAAWRLVYVLEDIPVVPPRGHNGHILRRVMDYVVDAHTGKVVSELPRSAHMVAATATALDGLGVTRRITVESSGTKRILRNMALNVQTFDFKFGDPETQRSRLPGTAIAEPPQWTPAAVSAHANATAVAEFLRTVLRRNNIDDAGGPMNSAINCVVVAQREEGLDPKEWRNAFWDGKEMCYGQVQFHGSLLSICVDLDVVAHEMYHGVTDNSSRLQYQRQSGALNESYSDIFGVIVANFSRSDTSTWNWKLGERLNTNGRPFRDMSRPRTLGQPEKMSQYRDLPITEDDGGVHTNSGIHNLAAYKLLTAKDASGQPAVAPAETAQIFYLANTVYLSRTSQFSDSRQAVVNSALSLFRNLPLAQRKLKLAAIDDAFDAVEIPGLRVVVS
jgi:Zn-dependent metalloprotease